VRTLSRRDRNLLRYQYFDHLTVDDIGALHRVHRATAARGVARAEIEEEPLEGEGAKSPRD
jgi:hypothetical protein